MNATTEHAGVPDGYMSMPGGGYVDTHQFSQWENTTEFDVVLELHKETPKHGKAIADRVANIPDPAAAKVRAWEEQTGKRRFVIPAKKQAFIPSEYDRAIQDVREGIIVGGLGPQLRKLGVEQRPVLSPALDAARARNAELQLAAEQALREKANAEQALAMAQGQLLIQQKKLEEATAPSNGSGNNNSNQKKDR